MTTSLNLRKKFTSCLVYFLILETLFPLSAFSGPRMVGQSGSSPTSISPEANPNFGVDMSPISIPSAHYSGESSSFARELSSPSLAGLGGSNRENGGFEQAGEGGRQKGSEFISGYYPGAVLIPVTITGAVPRNGLHYIPTRTNLLKLIALAGGIKAEGGNLSQVTIRRVNGDDAKENLKEEIIKVDLEKILETSGSRGPILQQLDMVDIPHRQPVIGNNTTLILGFVSSLLGIVVSAIVLTSVRK